MAAAAPSCFISARLRVSGPQSHPYPGRALETPARLCRMRARHKQCPRHITRPALGCVEGDHPDGMRILAAQDVLDNGVFVSFVFAGSRHRRDPDGNLVVQHDMYRDIKGARYTAGCDYA